MTVKSPMIGSVSTGTMRTEDLMPAFADALSLMPAYSDTEIVRRATLKLLDDVEKFLGAPEDSLPDWDSNQAQLLMEALFSELDNHAPLHMRFGSHVGDGADFGFWPDTATLMDAIDPTSILGVPTRNDNEYLLEDDSIIVHVNDHGNVTVMDMERNVLWSVV